MTASRDPDRMIRAFLLEGEELLPDQAYDAVRAEIEQKRQRAVIGPWRFPTMNRFMAVGAGAVAVLVMLFAGAQLFGSPSGGLGSQPTPTPTPTPEPTATPDASPSVAAGLPEGPHLLWDESGVAITVTIAAPDWDGDPSGGILCWGDPADDCSGPPDGAGMISFVAPEYYVYGDACDWSTTRPDAPATTVDELVGALANQASREASAPEDITLDGYAGKKIILDMADDVDVDACNEAEGESRFGLFGLSGDDPARYSQGAGQIEEVWAVDMDGLIVVLDGTYYADTPQNAVDELRAILASATFEGPPN